MEDGILRLGSEKKQARCAPNAMHAPKAKNMQKPDDAIPR